MVEITEEQYKIYEEAIQTLDKVLEVCRSVYLLEKRTKANGQKEYKPTNHYSWQDICRAFVKIKYLVDYDKFGIEHNLSWLDIDTMESKYQI